MRMNTKCLAAILAAALAAGTGAAWGSVDPTVSIAIGNNTFQSLNVSPTLLPGGTYDFGSQTDYSSSGFSWSDLTVTPSVISESGFDVYQLSLEVDSLTNSGSLASIAFQSDYTGYNLPAAVLLQGSLGADVSNGSSSDGISYSGAVADSGGSPSASLGSWSEALATNPYSQGYQYTDPLNIQRYGIAGPTDITTIGGAEFANGTTVNSLNPVTDVTTPEPATLALFVLGGLALLWPRRKRRKS